MGTRHRVPAAASVLPGALPGAPSAERWHGRRQSTTNKNLGAAASRATAAPATRPGLEGQVTTATPFAPVGAAQDGLRETVVDARWNGGSRRGTSMGRIRRSLTVAISRSGVAMSRVYFPEGPYSESACGVDKGICRLWFRSRELSVSAAVPPRSTTIWRAGLTQAAAVRTC